MHVARQKPTHFVTGSQTDTRLNGLAPDLLHFVDPTPPAESP